MSSRVSASLIHNCGLGEELVATSAEDYEERAVRLITNKMELVSIRSQLESNRENSSVCHLFAVEEWVHDFEQLLETISQI